MMKAKVKVSGEVCEVTHVILNTERLGVVKVHVSAVEFVLDTESISTRAQICPVCGGKGSVPECFYMGTLGTPTGSTTCRSCEGRGYVVV